MHKQVCEKGFNKKLNSFTQSYGSKDLDASCLRDWAGGFLPMDDPRIIGTVEANREEDLMNGWVCAALRHVIGFAKDGLAAG